jgi:Ser/Thr protein kinase RdoA (MazF antagonist)
MVGFVVNESFFPVQRSLLSASGLVERMLANYDLAAPPTCQFWRRGINDLYLVKVGGTKLMLRICPTGQRSFKQLAAEIDLLNYLHQNHFKVPRPIPQMNGSFIQALQAPEGTRYAVVFSFVPGTPHSPTKEHSFRFGQTIAQLHSITDNYPAGRAGLQFEPADMMDKPLVRLRPLFSEHQDDLDYLLEISRGLKQIAAKLPRRAPEYGVCHGDVNDGNFHVGEDDQWALLDFEYFGYGWRVFDIATFFNNQIHQLGKAERTKNILEAFLEGYQSVRTLSQAELEALPSFVVLRQIWLLGVGAKNQPDIGLNLFESWVFDKCMPFIREWMAGPLWRGVA